MTKDFAEAVDRGTSGGLDLTMLLASWQLSMKAERKALGTIKVYSDGVKYFLRWCDETNTPPVLSKTNVQQFLADLLDKGREGATAYARYKGLKQFTKWLTAEGEFDTDPLLGLKPP
ncbi:MAG: hypothetical protein QOC63_4987, partial [Mycobacterium sp.]|nr:hypothetical protein [Mycobacterium sp.]